MRLSLRIAASIFLGLALLFPVGAIYGAANLPVYHSWGLMHGSFATAIPALAAASFALLGLAPWFGPTIDPIPRAIASLSVLPLVTILFWVNVNTNYASFSVWHVAVYLAVFCLLTVLCLKSIKPVYVALFLLAPILIDPLFSLLIVGLSGLSGIELFGYDMLSKVLPVFLASTAAVALTRYIHVHKA